MAIFFLIVGPKRNKIILAWAHAARTHSWRRSVLTNLALFGLLLAATMALSYLAARSAQPPWHWFVLYCCLLLATALSGLAVGIAWIATDPGKELASPLGPWLQSLPAWLAAVWLSLRAFGSIALVPAAEELAFRGYLARALISIRFESIGFGEFRWLAFIGSSVAFGLMHQRWVAACLAGAVYALLMYRSKRLSDPIAAHVASNAAIMGWAIAAQQWSLL